MADVLVFLGEQGRRKLRDDSRDAKERLLVRRALLDEFVEQIAALAPRSECVPNPTAFCVSVIADSESMAVLKDYFQRNPKEGYVVRNLPTEAVY